MMDRRGFLRATAGAGLGMAGGSAAAAAGRVEAEIALFAAGAPVVPAEFGFMAEPLVESGYTVPIAVRPSGLAPSERIGALRVLAPANPLPRVVTLRFAAGLDGLFATRIRLARSQTVIALARTSLGRVLREERAIAVLVGGCGFDVEMVPG